MRLDVYVATYWPEYSRSNWQKYILAGYVMVNGQVENSVKRILSEDDEVTVNLPDVPDFSGQTIPVIYEDDNVTVINKPAGILTHAKGAPLDEFTVAEFMRPRTTDKPESNRPGIVHRLDRATSGVIICARTPEAHSFLQRQFSDRKAKKHYVAILSATPKQTEAILRLPIERNPAKPQQFRVGANGKPAETEYKVIKVFKNGKCLVDLYPKTGRTHQLRVHMNYLNTPIVGDTFYGGKGVTGPTDRMYLHAKSLEITIPGGKRMTFEAPLPKEFSENV